MSSENETRKTRLKSLPAIVISKLSEQTTEQTADSDSEESSPDEFSSPSIDPVIFRTKSCSPNHSSHETNKEASDDAELGQSDLSDPCFKKTPAFMQLYAGRRRLSEFGTGATGLLPLSQKPALTKPGSSSPTETSEKPHFSRLDLDRLDDVPEWSPLGRTGRRVSCSPINFRSSQEIDEELGEKLRKARATNRLLSVETSMGSFRPFASFVSKSADNRSIREMASAKTENTRRNSCISAADFGSSKSCDKGESRNEEFKE